jgi:hypothetical protein
LKENKRLKSEEDKLMMKKLKADIFNPKKDIMKTLKKYKFNMIHKLNEVTTTHNISYFKHRSDWINKRIHKLQKVPEEYYEIDDIKYYQGLEIVCKKHFKNAEGRLFVNYKYVIEAIDDKQFKVRDPVSKESMVLDHKMMALFSLPYCNTAHSVQGLTITNELTLFDVNSPYVDREFVYVSITRATDMKNVNIFVHPDQEISSLTQAKIRQYFKFKIDGYKSQDKKSNRKFDDKNYVTVEWISAEFHTCSICPSCNKRYELYVENGNVYSDVTIDRLENDDAHVIGNVRLCCNQCNMTRGNNYDL